VIHERAVSAVSVPRADVVGSLLRPPALLAARRQRDVGRLDGAAFKAIEDAAVDAAVAVQEEAGLDVVTDGEMRRLSFQSQMTEATEGFGAWDLGAFLWGEWRGDEAVGDEATARPADLGVVGRLRCRRHLSVEEFVYLRGRTRRTPKVTLPSPSLFANFWSPQRSADAYPTLEAFLGDVADILRDEVAELARLGATYIQLDAPHYPLLLDDATRAFYEARGWTLEQWLDLGIGLDNAVMEGAPGVTFGFHLCRGNQGSRWLAEGGYERIAAPLFGRVRAQRLMLEYDDARSGGFEPLAQVRDDAIVVLGLVTTKRPQLESADDLVARIEEAARIVPLERLAISPQCGFATSVLGNNLAPADQARKLARVAEVARRVWGG
jgi:5-methyltetrahydropteroyltriglutamate--homocysteine methyltransferase